MPRTRNAERDPEHWSNLSKATELLRSKAHCGTGPSAHTLPLGPALCPPPLPHRRMPRLLLSVSHPGSTIPTQAGSTLGSKLRGGNPEKKHRLQQRRMRECRPRGPADCQAGWQGSRRSDLQKAWAHLYRITQTISGNRSCTEVGRGSAYGSLAPQSLLQWPSSLSLHCLEDWEPHFADFLGVKVPDVTSGLPIRLIHGILEFGMHYLGRALPCRFSQGRRASGPQIWVRPCVPGANSHCSRFLILHWAPVVWSWCQRLWQHLPDCGRDDGSLSKPVLERSSRDFSWVPSLKRIPLVIQPIP